MKILLTVLLSGVVAVSTSAQHDPKMRYTVGFSCYVQGESSKPVQKVSDLLKRRDYKKIATLLESDNNAERYLAVVSIERLAQVGRYILNQEERKLISNIRRSEDPVYVCSGSTYFDKMKL